MIAFLRDITEDVALERRLLRQNQDLAVINLISEILSSSLNLAEVLEMTLSKILQVMNIETGWIFLLDEASQQLRVAYAHGLAQEVVNSIGALRLGEGIAGQVALSGEPLIIENASNDPRINVPALKALGLRSFASIPLKSRRRLIGVMNMGSFGQRTLSGDDKRLLLNIGLHMGTVIENVLLFEESASKSGELKQAMGMIEQRNEELKNLVDTVSHDLKNPIIAINGFCARLRRSAEAKLSEREIEYLSAIQESGRNMERFVSNLLSVSAAERVKVESAEIELAKLLREVVRDLTPQLEEKEGVIEIADDLPVIVADTTRVMQVFSNLISNAIKYAHPERKPLIRIFSSVDQNQHVFYVSDNGLGIPDAVRDNVFDIFFRAYDTIADGSGVGLSIVKRAIGAMGGEIWIDPASENGTTFVFTLPIKKLD
ncbi:MAG: Phytochrome-like protein cph1 [Deltaproteobacteria bacterium ADurb.Bin510]|nr:MAG: Phytochrome-like protein cph1 [Deltaproteobacteria bacterium ADurb.Bin510]